MAHKLLIANRGEIACRIIRTCRRLGIGTIAVFSSADRNSPHVEMADEAVRIGAAPSSDSYLNGESVIGAARRCGAWAIHPGFGFLSENAEFAAACAEAGFVFVGPSPAAISAMASKPRAKRIMSDAGIPTLEGNPAAARDDEMDRAAREIGFPVMVKPALGGGGRGMRVVEAPEDLAEALMSARREALSSFGSDALMLEKYLVSPRHIEVQIFGDGHGNLIHMHERDCSVQRRHQKVVEEAPASGLDDELRRRLGQTAIEAARAVEYVGAGTVEFLLDGRGEFTFMEMNTRLQVEHPVTELVTGTDLVEWQLRVADGAPLPALQEDIRIAGHAIEARLYAEDPANGFRPGFGRIAHLLLPDNQEGIRVDSGVRQGSEITVHYDPMMAKIIAHGPDRDTAADRLSDALCTVQVAGPTTNEMFLKAIVDHPAFRAGAVDTGFLETHLEALTRPASGPDVSVWEVAAIALLSRQGIKPADRSPWAEATGWRLGGTGGRSVALIWRGGRYAFRRSVAGEIRGADGAVLNGRGRWISDVRFEGTLGSTDFDAVLIQDQANLTVFLGNHRYDILVDDPLSAHSGAAGAASELFARMPGVVTAVNVEVGQTVSDGQPLLTMEAMKVEHTIRAPSAGRITKTPFGVGERVREGDELVGFEPVQPTAAS